MEAELPFAIWLTSSGETCSRPLGSMGRPSIARRPRRLNRDTTRRKNVKAAARCTILILVSSPAMSSWVSGLQTARSLRCTWPGRAARQPGPNDALPQWL